jgi:hypothetical protein
MGSAGSKGRGFQRVRVTECEDCLAVWKHSNFIQPLLLVPMKVTECEDCLAVWKHARGEMDILLGENVTEREDCLAVWKLGFLSSSFQRYCHRT